MRRYSNCRPNNKELVPLIRFLWTPTTYVYTFSKTDRARESAMLIVAAFSAASSHGPPWTPSLTTLAGLQRVVSQS